MLFYMIYLLLNIVVLCGCIGGKHLGLTVIVGLWLGLSVMFMPTGDAGYLIGAGIIVLCGVVFFVVYIATTLLVAGVELIKEI